MAKRREGAGDYDGAKCMRVRSLLVPAVLHGFYDFVATYNSDVMNIVFLVFVILMFITAWRLVKHVSANDAYIENFRCGFWG